jgi:predicted NBD/HSP70 family sugar kinase
MVTVAAVAGDAVDLESFRAVEAWLGHGMADLAAILDPRVFIIGGGVVEAGELLVGAADPAWANLQIYPLLRLDRHRSKWRTSTRLHPCFQCRSVQCIGAP